MLAYTYVVSNHGNREIDGSCQLCFVCFHHVGNSLAAWVSATCSSECCQGSAKAVSCVIIRHVKYPQLSIIRVGHCVPLAGFCLSLYRLHVLQNVNETDKHINRRIMVIPFEISHALRAGCSHLPRNQTVGNCGARTTPFTSQDSSLLFTVIV